MENLIKLQTLNYYIPNEKFIDYYNYKLFKRYKYNKHNSEFQKKKK